MKKFAKVFALILVVATVFALAIGFAGCNNDDSDILTVATEAKFAPYEYVENGEYKGFDMDLIRAIAKKMGYKDIEVKDVEFDAIIGQVQGNKNTVGIAAMTINPKRLETVNFSDPYLAEAYQVIVVEKSNTTFDNMTTKEEIFAALVGKTVNYAKGQTGQYLVEGNAAMNFPGINCTKKSYNDIPGAIAAVQNGAIALADNVVAEEQCEVNSNLKYIDIPLTYENYGIAINKNNPEMTEKINKALAELKAEGYIDELKEKYGIVGVN